MKGQDACEKKNKGPEVGVKDRSREENRKSKTEQGVERESTKQGRHGARASTK